MMKKALIVAVIVLAASQAFAAPNLYVNGSLIAQSPVAGINQDLMLTSNNTQIEFTLLAESTSYANRNSLFLHNWGSNSIYQTIFDDNDGVGTTRSFNLNGNYGFSLLSDQDDNGRYRRSEGDRWLFSDREYTAPSSMPDDDYQFFRGYNTPFGNANYFFEDGNISFSGDYDFLLFIDDARGGVGNYDHNDMVVGGRYADAAVPEPATIVLLGMGLVGAGVFRRFRK